MANFIRELMIGLMKNPNGSLVDSSPIFALKQWFPTLLWATEGYVPTTRQ